MGLIRKQAGLDLREKILRWRDNFLDSSPHICNLARVNEDFTIDPSSMPRSILHKLINDPDLIIPEYILFDFSRVNYVPDVSFYGNPKDKFQDILNRLNKIDKHFINLPVLDIALNSALVNFRVERVEGEWVETHFRKSHF